MDTGPVETHETSDEHAPRALELLPILPIVLVVAWVVRSYELYPWVSTQTALAISMAGAALIGLPALFWALDHGRRGLVTLVPLGALVGMMPLAFIVSSAALGLTFELGRNARVRRSRPIGEQPFFGFTIEECRSP